MAPAVASDRARLFAGVRLYLCVCVLAGRREAGSLPLKAGRQAGRRCRLLGSSALWLCRVCPHPSSLPHAPCVPRPRAGERWGRDWALLALAAADNTALCLEHYCDALAG